MEDKAKDDDIVQMQEALLNNKSELYKGCCYNVVGGLIKHRIFTTSVRGIMAASALASTISKFRQPLGTRGLQDTVLPTESERPRTQLGILNDKF